MFETRKSFAISCRADPRANRQSVARFVLAFGVVFFLMSAPATAQTGTLPAEQFRQKAPQQPADRPSTELPVVPDVDVPDVGPGGVRFLLKQVRFDCNPALADRGCVFSEADLRAVVADQIGQSVGFADLKRISQAVNRLYSEGGYLAVRAFVPPQEIVDGTLTIRIVESRIAEIEILGELGGAEAEVRDRLDRLRDVRPIKLRTIERQLLLARDVSGINLVSSLRALRSQTDGDLALIVEASFAPVDGFATVSNLASDTTGPFLGTIGVGLNSVAISGDRLQLIGLTSFEPGEQVLGQVSYTLPTGIDGLSASFLFSTSASEAGGVLSPLDIDYRGFIGRASLDYTAVRDRDSTLEIGGFFEAVSQEQNAPFAPLEINEDLRVLGLSARWVEQDILGGFLHSSAELRFGLSGLGASEAADPATTGDPGFVSFDAESDFSWPVIDELTVRTSARGQISTGDLPSFEVLSLGNFTTGRGFDPGTATGDDGFAGSFELIFHPRLGPLPFLERPEMYAFIDAGRVFNDGDATDLVSAGLGLRVTILEDFDLDGFLAFPVSAPAGVDEDGFRAFFRTVARY